MFGQRGLAPASPQIPHRNSRSHSLQGSPTPKREACHALFAHLTHFPYFWAGTRLHRSCPGLPCPPVGADPVLCNPDRRHHARRHSASRVSCHARGEAGHSADSYGESSRVRLAYCVSMVVDACMVLSPATTKPWGLSRRDFPF